jgi:maltooligosyltrehalose trehalohydrolase
MEPFGEGYFSIELDAPPGTRYRYCLDGAQSFPDPASRYQPEGVHGPSVVVDLVFDWHDQAWHGLPLENLIIYELHVGAYSPQGTFEAVIPRLPLLRDLGITAIQLMPIAQFPGNRNWGYDGVYPFAAQASYGGPDGLRRLVDACHQAGLAVILDVVYNHLGPEGNYLAQFGHYFTTAHHTPWGPAFNFDGPESDAVRRFFIENALYWTVDCHIDALRLDAVHAIYDNSARPFLEELADHVHQAARRRKHLVWLLAESNLNDPRLVQTPQVGGMGLDAQWNDDFYRALTAMLTGQTRGVLIDYGQLSQLAKAWREGYVFTGEYSQYHKRRHGRSPASLDGPEFIIYSHNHDHPRLIQRAGLEGHKLAAASVLLAPYVPLLMMGEEYAEEAPFPFFTSHGDSDLITALLAARCAEHRALYGNGEPPDCQDEATFASARLNFEKQSRPPGSSIWAYYRHLLRLRREIPALRELNRRLVTTWVDEFHHVLHVVRRSPAGDVFLVFHFGFTPERVVSPGLHGKWRRLVDSADTTWDGPGTLSPETFDMDQASTLQLAPLNVVAYHRIA